MRSTEAQNARIICLSLKEGQHGRVLWTHRTSSHVECTPVVSEDHVYIGAGDDGYYCIALEPTADGTADVKWHLSGEDYPDAETSLAVHDGKVYAGLGVGGMALCVLDAKTGEQLQRIDIETWRPLASAQLNVNAGGLIKVRDRIIAASSEKYHAVSLTAEGDEIHAEAWLDDVSWLGQPVVPLSSADGRIWVPARGWGMMCLGGPS